MCTPFRLVVLFKSFLQIISATDVIRFIGTLEDIDEIRHMERVSFRREVYTENSKCSWMSSFFLRVEVMSETDDADSDELVEEWNISSLRFSMPSSCEYSVGDLIESETLWVEDLMSGTKKCCGTRIINNQYGFANLSDSAFFFATTEIDCFSSFPKNHT